MIVNGSRATEFRVADGIADTFVLADTPIDENAVLIATKDGVRQLQALTKDYTFDMVTKTVTFTYTPVAGDEFQFKYMVGADA